MFRIDDPTAAAALPAAGAAGTPGFFTGGDPAALTPPTLVTPAWLNMVQEEIRAVVLAGGGTPDKANNGQMAAAIAAILAANGTAFGHYVFGDTGLATGNLYLVDVSAGGPTVNLTLPLTPAIGARIWISDVTGWFDRFPPKLVRNGELIGGLAQDCNLTIAGLRFGVIYTAAGWSFF